MTRIKGLIKRISKKYTFVPFGNWRETWKHTQDKNDCCILFQKACLLPLFRNPATWRYLRYGRTASAWMAWPTYSSSCKTERLVNRVFAFDSVWCEIFWKARTGDFLKDWHFVFTAVFTRSFVFSTLNRIISDILSFYT